MNFIEYNKQIDSTISRILDENLLFWNLWCMSFVFDKIETDYKYLGQTHQNWLMLFQAIRSTFLI